MPRRPTIDAECVTCRRHLPPNDSVCLATEQCMDAYVAYCIKHSPGMAQVNERDPAAFREAILKNHQQKGSTAMATATKERKPREKKVKDPAFCHFCGGQTLGGNFHPGHDASLKGVLNRQARDEGDVDALVELLVRAWPLTDGIDGSDTLTKASAKLKGMREDAKAEFVADRAAARIKALSNGSDLEKVYGDSLTRKSKPKAEKAEKPAAKASKPSKRSTKKA